MALYCVTVTSVIVSDFSCNVAKDLPSNPQSRDSNRTETGNVAHAMVLLGYKVKHEVHFQIINM